VRVAVYGRITAVESADNMRALHRRKTSPFWYYESGGSVADTHKKQQHEKAYGDGVREARESDPVSQFAHNINPFGPSTTTEQSHEAGWNDYWQGKVKSPPSHKPKYAPEKRRKSSPYSARVPRGIPHETARTGGSLNHSIPEIQYSPPRKAGLLVVGLLMIAGGLGEAFLHNANPQFSAPKFWIGFGLALLLWRFYIRRKWRAFH